MSLLIAAVVASQADNATQIAPGFSSTLFSNSTTASWVQAGIYVVTVGVLIWQAIVQNKSVKLQTLTMQDSAYLRCQVDFTGSMRLLVKTGLHDMVYNNLNASGSKFVRWSEYNEE